MLNGKKEEAELDAQTVSLIADSDRQDDIFNPQERLMIERVLNLNQRTVSSIMTSCHDVAHVKLAEPEAHIREILDKNQHTRIVITDDKDEILGVVHVSRCVVKS